MRTLVTIPTYNNGHFDYSIKDTLDGLVKQTYKKFSVLVVYKPSPSDNTRDIVDNYRGKLGIEIVIQETGYFEEALNIIYKVAKDYDFLLTLDDDSIPSNEWVTQHLSLHQTFDNIAAIGGGTYSIDDTLLPPNHNILMRTIRRAIGYQQPLYGQFVNYFTFINDMGLLVPTNSDFVRQLPDNIVSWNKVFEHFMLLLSIGFAGANSSYKAKYLDGFELPGATLRGLGNEAALATYFTKQGVKCAVVNSCTILHRERESLSRARSDEVQYAVSLENHVMPYLINCYEAVNHARLGAYRSLLQLYAPIRRTMLSRAYLQGLTISEKAIEEAWKPAKVRDAIRNCILDRGKIISQVR